MGYDSWVIFINPDAHFCAMVSAKIQDMVKRAFDKNTYPAAESKKIFKEIERFSSALQAELDKEGVSADVFHGGSSAKGTFLKGNFDVDLFVRFDLKKYGEFSSELSDILHRPLERATSGNFERLHGSRDYFQHRHAWKFPINFEVVPVLRISRAEEAKNVTDCSPLHVLWLKDKMSKKPGLVKQSVATKLFLKSIGAYGAESYIKGFSGHVVDILTVSFGSFEALLRDSMSWEKHHVIDVEGYYRDKGHVLQSLDESKVGPLIVIDPIQADRNAAAALSKEKLEMFRSSAKEFLAHPKMSFFTVKKFSLSSLKKDSVPHCQRIIIKLMPCVGKKDVVGSKLLKLYDNLVKGLKRAGFDIFDSGWAWPNSNAYIWLYITKNSISYIKKNPEIVREGPPLDHKQDVKRFKEKNPNNFRHGNRIYARVPRKVNDYMEIIHKTIKEEKHKNSIRSFNILSENKR